MRNDIGAAGAVEFGKGLAGLTQLHRFSLGENHIGDVGAAGLVKGLAMLVQLQRLDLGDNQIGDAGASALGKSLKRLTQLQHLNLQENKIGDAGAVELGNGFARLEQLQHLDLGRNQIEDAGAAALGKNLVMLTQLHRLCLEHNLICDAGASALGKSLVMLTQLQHLNLQENKIGDAGAVELGNGFARLAQLKRLSLGGNHIQGPGAAELAKGLTRLDHLQRLDLDTKPQDARGHLRVPAEVESKGWMAVIKFLKKLEDQNAGNMSVIRVILAGDSQQGKTSLRLALTDPRGLTHPIAVDNRTIAVDEGTWNAGSFTVHFWDLAGQEAYRAAQSIIASGDRSIYLLVYSPLVHLTAEVIFQQCLMPWLNLMYSVSPGARVYLVSTHLETPGQGYSASCWKQHVSQIADQVMARVMSTVKVLEGLCQKEIHSLTKKKELLQHCQTGFQMSSDASDSKRRRIGSGHRTSASSEPYYSKPGPANNCSEIQAVNDRLQIIQDASGGPKKFQILTKEVVLLDSVEGDGSSVLMFAEQLRTLIPSLPFMNYPIPKGWERLLEECKSLSTLRKQKLLANPLMELRPRDWGLSEESASDGLRFWNDLGFVRFYKGMLVLEVQWLVDIVRPLLHHDLKNVIQALCAEDPVSDNDRAVVDIRMGFECFKDKLQLLDWAEQLEEMMVLNVPLLDFLSPWSLMSHKERQAALDFLEKCHLVVQSKRPGSQSSEWMVVSRAARMKRGPVDCVEQRFKGPAVKYTTDCVIPLPPDLFSTFCAVLIQQFRTEQLLIQRVKSDYVFLSWGPEHEKSEILAFIEGNNTVILRALSMGLLIEMIQIWNDVANTRYPGSVLQCLVVFKFEKDFWSWELNDSVDSLLDILTTPGRETEPANKTVRLRDKFERKIDVQDIFSDEAFSADFEFSIADVNRQTANGGSSHVEAHQGGHGCDPMAKVFHSIFPNIDQLKFSMLEFSNLELLFRAPSVYRFDPPILFPDLNRDSKCLLASTVLHWSGHMAPVPKVSEYALTAPNQHIQVLDGLCSLISKKGITSIELVFLNMCSSYNHGSTLSRAGVPYVVCWKTSCRDEACQTFSTAFYRCLVHTGSHGSAFKEACQELVSKFCPGDPEVQNRNVGIPCLLWNDDRGVDKQWTSEQGLQGEKAWTPDWIDQALRGWREPVGEKDKGAHAGKCEKACLVAMGFSTQMPDGSGEFSVSNGGMCERGFLSEAALRVLGVGEYEELWGARGKVVSALGASNAPPVEKVREAAGNLKKAIDYRNDSIEYHKRKPQTDKRRAEVERHEEVVRVMKQTWDALNKALMGL
mmetsp:Transcript_71377/g.190631  ORF Transcript_71377/g.190631 Transcript_71377/m.190631 type:complete len:1308 (-) Transcript_71377:342-4265(-)